VAAYRRRLEADLSGAVKEVIQRIPSRSKRGTVNMHLTSWAQIPAGNHLCPLARFCNACLRVDESTEFTWLIQSFQPYCPAQIQLLAQATYFGTVRLSQSPDQGICRVRSWHDYSTRRGCGAPLPHCQPSLLQCKSSHYGREPCVSVQIGREDKNEARSRRFRFGSGAYSDSIDQQ